MAELENLAGPESERVRAVNPWLGAVALFVAAGVLVGALAVFTTGSPVSGFAGLDDDGLEAPPTTDAKPRPPNLIIARETGVYFNQQLLSTECAHKAISDEIGGLFVDRCDGTVVYTRGDGTTEELPFEGLETAFIPDGQRAVTVLFLAGPRSIEYSAQTRELINAPLLGYSAVSQGRRIRATVGIGPAGEPDPGCLLAPPTDIELGCGDDPTEVIDVAVSPQDNRLVVIQVDGEGEIEARVLGLGSADLIAWHVGLESIPLEVDFDGDWLALAFETADGPVTRLIHMDTYHSEDIEGVASFRQAS